MTTTYLERHAAEFPKASREELVKHGLNALKESLATGKELTVENTSVGAVGRKEDGSLENFKLYDGQEVKQWIDLVAEGKEAVPAAAVEAMDVDA